MSEAGNLFQYVGHKVSKVRWIPPTALGSSTPTTLAIPTGYFVSAGYDDNMSFIERKEIVSTGLDARRVAMAAHQGGVTDLCFPARDYLLTASDNGKVFLYSLKETMDEVPGVHIAQTHSLDLHHFPSGSSAPITSVSVQPNTINPEIMTAGEDGTIKLFSLESLSSVKGVTSIKLESSVVKACYNDSQLIVTASGPRMKIWDRQGLEKNRPVLSAQARGGVTINCIAVHPNQPNVLATGCSNGSVAYWDMRNPAQPFSNLKNVHSADVWEVAFHPSQSASVLSCSEDGMVGLSDFRQGQDASAPRHFHNILATSLSVNSFDVSEDLLVYGTDNECLVFSLLA